MGTANKFGVGFFALLMVSITACQSTPRNQDAKEAHATIQNKKPQIVEQIQNYIKTAKPILSEDFSSAGDWPTSPGNEAQDNYKSGKSGYQDGKYFIEANPGFHKGTRIPNSEQGEFVLEINSEVTTVDASATGNYTIAFLGSGKDNYRITVNSNGYYSLDRWTKEGGTVLQSSKLESASGAKKIQIIVKGSHIFALIDEALTLQCDDRSISSGNFSIDVWSSGTVPYRVEFDNARIWSLADYR
jgi:hypothetical protein